MPLEAFETAVDLLKARVVDARLQLSKILLRRKRVRHGLRERLGLTLGLLLGEANFS